MRTKILRKSGWDLNPSDKVVNSILARIEANDGHCPCHNTGHDTVCPCSDYRENNVCHCTLYVKKKEQPCIGVVVQSPIRPLKVSDKKLMPTSKPDTIWAKGSAVLATV